MNRAWFAVFFFLSGFSALVYEVVWLRLAMAAFGVNTLLVAIVLSVFMAGFALGAWAGGRLVTGFAVRDARRGLRLYALAEVVVATSGLTVPWALDAARGLLAGGADSMAWGSTAYYLASGSLVTLALLPFCTCMGATFPFAMASLGAATDRERSFSYLYMANVAGATVGTLASAFVLIELLGFRSTLLVAASVNALLAFAAFVLGQSPASEAQAPVAARPRARAAGSSTLVLLFTTGLASMAAEVVWVRQFTPYLDAVVYAFALILGLYLSATFVGSRVYRARLPESAPGLWIALGPLALLPLAAADPRLGAEPDFATGVVRLTIGIVPFCAALGYVTPMLVDRWSAGDPGRAGSAYAVNVTGAIVGPLLAGFVLLPTVGERGTLGVMAASLFVAGAWAVVASGARRWRPALTAALLASAALGLGTRDFADRFAHREIRRDYTATVIATREGPHVKLLVNGVGMTTLLPTLKIMAHLPLASLARRPERGLVICFGMGTTFRSLLAWDVDATAVELVPSVPRFFGYYHPDGPALLRLPRAHVVIDDGRRFLERSRTRWDLITIDPPPPVDGAGASLLYTREFYEVVKARLASDGVVQQWLPGSRAYHAPESHLTAQASIARTIREAFPYLRTFVTPDGGGVHFIASLVPLPRRTAAELAARLPAAAAADLVEWGPQRTAEAQLEAVLRGELDPNAIVAVAPDAPTLTDDHPLNEYFFLRRVFHPDYQPRARGLDGERLAARSPVTSVDRRPPRVPVGDALIGVADPEHGRLGERAADDLHGERAAVGREPARHRERG